MSTNPVPINVTLVPPAYEVLTGGDVGVIAIERVMFERGLQYPIAADI